MGWSDSHLHQFKIHGLYYGVPDRELGLETVNEKRATLNEVVQREKEHFLYEYDFGDSWEHDIAVEKIIPREDGVQYPRVLAGKRAGPPEDVGGVWGYDSFLETLRDPNHPEHADMLEWVGGEFDPEALDLDRINQMLKRVR